MKSPERGSCRHRCGTKSSFHVRQEESDMEFLREETPQLGFPGKEAEGGWSSQAEFQRVQRLRVQKQHSTSEQLEVVP